MRVLGLPLEQVAYVGAFLLAAVACAASVPRARRIEDPDTRRGLTWLLLLSGGWATAHVAYLLLPGRLPKLAAYLVGLVVGFATTGAWLYFCSAYTRRSLHRATTYRWLAVTVFVGVVALKVSNPYHGLYFTASLDATPFTHLAIRHKLLHWLAMGLSYALAAIGYFMLLELFAQTGYDSRPLAVLVGLTGLPLVLDILGRAQPWLIDMTYEPLGVAAFAVGTLFLFFERFQALQIAGDVDDAVVFVDEEGTVRDANDRAAEYFPALAEAVGEPFDEAVPAVAERLADEEDRVMEVERDGETRYLMLSTNPFSFGNTRVGRLVVITDVTRTERYRREIERKNERRVRVAAVISHDLRNPLNVARGRVGMERGLRDSENLEQASEALERMEELIENVLTLARRGEDVGEQHPVTLRSVAEDAWETVATDGAALEVTDDLSLVADEDRLRQLLENLFRNSVEHGSTSNRTQSGDAVEHAPAGDGEDDAVTATEGETVVDGPDLTVRVGPTADGDGFYVADDGAGIPAGERDAVFEFGHSDAGGSGLGLTIVETIARGHGWQVTAGESEHGGARFTFTGVELAQPEPEA